MAGCLSHSTLTIKAIDLGRCTKKGVGVGNQKFQLPK
jgi:hypothetical protein